MEKLSIPSNKGTASASPTMQRKACAYVDAIHESPHKETLAPAQLYSTASGRLFHSGRIVIATAGPPARGKTASAISLARYLRWLGVKTRVFHLGDYRRATVEEIPDDYFFVHASPSTVALRQQIIGKCQSDIFDFLDSENAQVAIYDAVNPLASARRDLVKVFAARGVQTIFIEFSSTDQKLIEDNVRSVKLLSPDYQGWDQAAAVKDYLNRINARIPHFEELSTSSEKDLHFVKIINAGQRCIINNCSFNYLAHRIVFFLLNLRIKSRQIYFVRAGTATQDEQTMSDAHLSEEGVEYSKRMSDSLLAFREKERQEAIASGAADASPRSLTVWTSTKRRSVETGFYLASKGYIVRQRPQMRQLDAGVCEQLTEEELRERYPEEVKKHEADPYFHRYSRAESCHDVAVRLESIIMEMEREQTDLLIICHVSVMRNLYGYLMACSASDIPNLEFPRDEIIAIVPRAYENEALRIPIQNITNDVSSEEQNLQARTPTPTHDIIQNNLRSQSAATTRSGTPLFSAMFNREQASRTGSPNRSVSEGRAPGDGGILPLRRHIHPAE